MIDKQSRKEIHDQYKQRKQVGGVFVIRNTVNGKIWIDASVDLAGSRNRFAFAQSTGSAVVMKLQKDWQSMGPQVFSFEILEELTKKEAQGDAEFKEDLQTLKEIWREKLGDESFY